MTRIEAPQRLLEILESTDPEASVFLNALLDQLGYDELLNAFKDVIAGQRIR